MTAYITVIGIADERWNDLSLAVPSSPRMYVLAGVQSDDE
jgi:hypothetical protein